MNKAICVIIAFIIVLLSCTGGERIAGSGGGSETTNGVSACVRFNDGTPIAGSVVRLRPADYVSKLPQGTSESIVDIKNGLTDSSGRFLFTGINPGEYCIEVQNFSEDSLKKGSVVFTGTVRRNDTTDLGTDSIRPYATLVGSIDSAKIGDSPLYARIRGLERIKRVNEDGTFLFDDLPEGYFDVVIIAENQSDESREIIKVKTNSKDTVSLQVSPDFTYTGYLSIDTEAAQLSEAITLTNFPLLVRLDSSTFDFNKADNSGRDIRFFSMNKVPLAHEIEQWDPVSQRAAIWILVDEIWGGNPDPHIMMQWGAPAAHNLSNGTTVFDTANGFAGVWHLNENPSAGANAIRDRTVNEYHGTCSGTMTSQNITAGVIGEALSFNGSTDTIEAGMLNVSDSYTLSCWVKPSRGLNTNWRFIIKEASYTLWFDTKWDGIRAEHFTDVRMWRGIYQDTPDSIPNFMALEEWSHIACTYDGKIIRLYVNGEAVDSSQSIASSVHVHNEYPVLFGGRELECFRGVMDEIRIESVARTPEWIRFVYLTQHPDNLIIGPRLR